MMKKSGLRKTLAAATLLLPLLVQAATPVVNVFKSEGCGCCEEWIRYLQQNGFTVKAQNVPDTADYRAKFGIPEALGSCHSAIVDGYALEGHVPAREIKRLLSERPKAKGLAVPSMPPGSPGMEGARRIPYDVLLVKGDGSYSIYQHYSDK